MARKKTLESDDLITQTEAAKLRNVSLHAINNLIRRGKLQGVERFGKTLVSRPEVLAYHPSSGGWPKGKARKVGRKA